jgi:hypothetical protein
MRSRLSFVLLVGLLLGLLSSCGGKPEVLTEKTLFKAVTAAQAEKGSFHTVVTRTGAPGQTIRSYGDVELGKNAKDTSMAMTVSGAPSGTDKIEIRVINQTLYFGLGALTKNKFVKIDLADKSNPLLQQAGDAIANLDPARQFKQYESGIVKFDTSGKLVKIDDVETQPYKITIDPSKASQPKGGLDAAKLPKKMVLTLYVGPDNLSRRAVLQVPATAGASSVRQQTDFSKWGEHVSIAAPTSLVDIKDTPLSQLGQLTGQ